MSPLLFRRLGIGPSGPVIVERAGGAGWVVPPAGHSFRSLRRLAREGTRLLGCERSGIWKVEPDGSGPVCLTRFVADSQRHEEMQHHPDALGRHTVAMLERIAFLSMEDGRNAAPPAPPLRAYLESEGVRSLLAVPIRVNGAVHGFQTFEHLSGPREWTEEDRDHARDLAGQVERLWAENPPPGGRRSSSHREEPHDRAERTSRRPAPDSPLKAPVAVRSRSERALDLELRRLGALEAAGVLGLDVARSIAGLLEVQAGLLQLDNGLDEELVADLRNAVERARDRLARYRNWARRGRDGQQRIELNALLGAIAARLGKLAGEEVGLVLAPSAEPLVVRGQPELLSDAIEHLVRNARQASPAGSRVRVGLTANRESGRATAARIVVEDRGEGIERGDLPWIFEPWFTTRRERGAEGLGLPVVQAVVEGHGGRVDVVSTVGGGTRVELHLPLAGESLADGPESEASRSEHPSSGTGPRALLLSGDDLTARLLKRSLARVGIDVRRARSTADAERMLEEGTDGPALLVLCEDFDDGSTISELVGLAERARPALPVLLVDTDGLAGDEADEPSVLRTRLAPPLDPKRLEEAALALIEAGRRAADEGDESDPVH